VSIHFPYDDDNAWNCERNDSFSGRPGRRLAAGFGGCVHSGALKIIESDKPGVSR